MSAVSLRGEKRLGWHCREKNERRDVVKVKVNKI